MGTRWESATLPDAVSPFSVKLPTVSLRSRLSPDGWGLEIFGKTEQLMRTKSEDLPFATGTRVCGTTDIDGNIIHISYHINYSVVNAECLGSDVGTLPLGTI